MSTKTNEKSVFAVLNGINVKDVVKEKNGLSYLSWAWAWAKVKEKYPEANYTIYENADGLNYHTDGNTAWVKTGVTINGLEHIEFLPVMDHRNKSIPVANLTSYDVNKSIQRSLTKALARHGLGLYLYVGEDMPIPEKEARTTEPRTLEELFDDIPEDEPLHTIVAEFIDASDRETIKRLSEQHRRVFKSNEPLIIEVARAIRKKYDSNGQGK